MRQRTSQPIESPQTLRHLEPSRPFIVSIPPPVPGKGPIAASGRLPIRSYRRPFVPAIVRGAPASS
jgi:hypothetical protein